MSTMCVCFFGPLPAIIANTFSNFLQLSKSIDEIKIKPQVLDLKGLAPSLWPELAVGLGTQEQLSFGSRSIKKQGGRFKNFAAIKDILFASFSLDLVR